MMWVFFCGAIIYLWFWDGEGKGGSSQRVKEWEGVRLKVIQQRDKQRKLIAASFILSSQLLALQFPLGK